MTVSQILRFLIGLQAPMSAPPPAPPPPPSRAPALAFERFTLPNGLEVVLHRMETVPIVSLFVTYRVGSANERAGRSGFAHLFEHLLFKDTRHVSGSARNSRLIELGGGSSASTLKDVTVYSTWAASNALELLIYYEAERMTFLLGGITDEILQAEKGVVRNERLQRVDNVPYGKADLLISQELYGVDHPYHRPPIGSLQDIAAATLEDVRAFHSAYYGPANAQVIIVGDLDVAEAKPMVEKWLGAVPAGEKPPTLLAPVTPRLGERRVFHEDDVSAPQLVVAWPTAPGYTAGDAAADMLSEILGPRLQRRLVDDLRLAQDVSVNHATRPLTGEFRITITAASVGTLERIDQVVLEEVRRIQETPPTDAELRRRVLAREGFIRNVEATGGMGDRLSAYLRYTGMVDFFDDDFARFVALSPSDLSDAARSFLSTQRRAVLSIVPTGRPQLAVPGSTPIRSLF